MAANLIFKQNIMATTNTESAVSGLINKAKLFSKLRVLKIFSTISIYEK